jgi:hypothetical protein
MTGNEDAFRKKYFYLLCYQSLTSSKVAAENLWVKGVMIYKNATCIKTFTDLEKIEFSATRLNQKYREKFNPGDQADALK